MSRDSSVVRRKSTAERAGASWPGQQEHEEEEQCKKSVMIELMNSESLNEAAECEGESNRVRMRAFALLTSALKRMLSSSLRQSV